MAKKQLEAELLEDSHIFLQPERYRIMELLSEKTMHISELSRALPEERRLVAYHLAALEDRGFVPSRYEISERPRSRGKALRVYTVTDKVSEVKAKLKKGQHSEEASFMFSSAGNEMKPPPKGLINAELPSRIHKVYKTHVTKFH
jgi:DNA-binding transcriptional ArsR family regulator